MSLLNKIFEFLKGLATRPGLHTFLQRYQHVVTTKLEELAHVNSGKGLNEWKDSAFDEIKSMLVADSANLKDNWVSLAIGLAWEVIKAEQEKHELKKSPDATSVDV